MGAISGGNPDHNVAQKDGRKPILPIDKKFLNTAPNEALLTLTYTRLHRITPKYTLDARTDTKSHATTHLVTENHGNTSGLQEGKILVTIDISGLAGNDIRLNEDTEFHKPSQKDTLLHSHTLTDRIRLKMKQEIIQRLHELSESITERHGWAVLKSHIEAIDEVIAAGVKTKAMEEALAELGLNLAPTSLRSALYRYRKKRKSNRVDHPIRVATTCSAPQLPSHEEDRKKSESLLPNKEAEATPTSENPWAYKSKLTSRGKGIPQQPLS